MRDDIVEQMNADRPAILETLHGRVVAFAAPRSELRMDFDIGLAFCHSVDIVQGGIVTAMLDTSMAHAILALERHDRRVVRMSSIDIQVSFLRPARAGRFSAVGWVVKAGRSVAFLRAELFDAKGDLIATATSSAHLTREHRQERDPGPS